MTDCEPTERDAASLVRSHLGTEPVTVRRFTTGLANYVYEVHDAANETVVVRLNRPRHGDNFAGALYWHRLLAAQGVPLPDVLYHDAAPTDGSFPFMITARVPGRDLDAAYLSLRTDQKRTLAWSLTEVQSRAGRLPLGPGFGYARSYTDPSLHRTWLAFLQAELAWSRDLIERGGIVDPAWADRVGEGIERYHLYFDAVEPRCFLDDIALKNVIVDSGRLSGIVDVDWVCFGDFLLPVALAQARLWQRAWDTDLITFWTEDLDRDEVRREILALYTALWLVNTLALIGRRFGNCAEVPTDRAAIARLTGLLGELIPRL